MRYPAFPIILLSLALVFGSASRAEADTFRIEIDYMVDETLRRTFPHAHPGRSSMPWCRCSPARDTP